MINFNGQTFLPEAIKSVLEQECKDYELVIQDGMSTDASAQIIEGFSETNKQIHFLKSLDRGPAHALNLAINRANGCYLLFLNSDDLLLPHALKRMNEIAEQYISTDIFLFGGFIQNEIENTKKLHYPKQYSLKRYVYGVSVPLHQATLFKRESITKRNISFNEENYTCWDAEFLLKSVLNGCTVKNFREPLAIFRIHKDSISGTGTREKEYHEDLKRLFYSVMGRKFTFLDHFLGYLWRLISIR